MGDCSAHRGRGTTDDNGSDSVNLKISAFTSKYSGENISYIDK
jgi:hypothetical protein